MRKRFGILFAVLLVAGLGALLWQIQPPHEPAYAGDPLRVWLERYRENSYQAFPDRPDSPSEETLSWRTEARTAVRQMGTNTLPFLLRMMRVKDSEFRSTGMLIMQKVSTNRFWRRSEMESHSLAAYGFGALGPAAKPAVPVLIQLLNDPNWDIRKSAAFALGIIEPVPSEAVPALLQHLYDPAMNGEVILALGNMRSESELVVPALIKGLGQSNRVFPAQMAIIALGQYGEKAKVATPVLLPYLSDPAYYTRLFATNALRAIDPKTTPRR